MDLYDLAKETLNASRSRKIGFLILQHDKGILKKDSTAFFLESAKGVNEGKKNVRAKLVSRKKLIELVHSISPFSSIVFFQRKCKNKRFSDVSFSFRYRVKY